MTRTTHLHLWFLPIAGLVISAALTPHLAAALVSDARSAQAQSHVIVDDTVDEAYLRRLDEEVDRDGSVSNRRRLAQAYQEAATFLAQKGQPEVAIEKYRHALGLAPVEAALTVGLGDLLVKQQRPWDAIDLLLPAADQFPQSADVAILLGSAYYALGDMEQASAQWQKALAIEDNPKVREAVAKAERERAVAGSYQELRSDHFVLRYDEGQVSALADGVLKTLEGDFRDLALELDTYPPERIIVQLYPKQDFRSVTQSPDWTGGMNDGKIRVPVSGLSFVTPALARVLKHELTHSFVYQATQGRCPAWFNEGLAELEEGTALAPLGPSLASAFASGRVAAYPALEHSFIDMRTNEARLAYVQSLAAVDYLRDTYGLELICQLLKHMASTSDFGSLLQQDLQLTYPLFQQNVTLYVERRYGRQ